VKRVQLSVEDLGRYGKTVEIQQQNVCKTQTNGAYTAQQCENAMIGRPEPVNTASATAALSYTLLASPLKAVIGVQPMWTWNSETNQKNGFSVFLFVGARPSVPN
jgi:hypothetical protein